MQNELEADDGIIRIIPEEVFIYEKALQDLDVYEAVDRPAQRLTLLMGPKKPIDYENPNSSKPDTPRISRKSQMTLNKISVQQPDESERNSKLEKPSSIST